MQIITNIPLQISNVIFLFFLISLDVKYNVNIKIAMHKMFVLERVKNALSANSNKVNKYILFLFL